VGVFWKAYDPASTAAIGGAVQGRDRATTVTATKDSYAWNGPQCANSTPYARRASVT